VELHKTQVEAEEAVGQGVSENVEEYSNL